MDKLINLLEKAISLGQKEIEFPDFALKYLDRLKSMKNRVGGITDRYSPSWYKYRKERFGYTNINRNYHLTYKMRNTMRITNKAIYTEADYYKFLVKKFPHEVPSRPY